MTCYEAFDMGDSGWSPAPRQPAPAPRRPAPPPLPVAIVLRASWWRRLVARLAAWRAAKH